MKKEDIVKRVFEEGLMVSPAAIPMIDESNIDGIIKKARGAGAKMIDVSLFAEAPSSAAPEIVIESHMPAEKMTPKDFSSFYAEKYEGIRQLLVGKIKPVSINNAAAAKEVSVIGMVKEMNPQGFVLEDPTGEIAVVSNESGITEDDVIGVSGFVREGRITGSKVIYPDIPLNRKIGTASLRVALSGKPRKHDADILLSAESGEGATHFAGNPARATIGDILILKVDMQKADPEEATMWLKKRHLPHTRKPDSAEDDLLMKRIPDIIWINAESGKWTKIYKGVIVVSTSASDAVVINMENKEIEFV